MEEIEYRALIEWYCQQLYYNTMLSYAKEACDTYPTTEILRILLSLAFALTGKPHEAIKEATEVIDEEDSILPALLIQSYSYRIQSTIDRSLLNQLDARIREERRRATPVALATSGLILLLLRRMEKAKEYIDRAYKASPTNTDVLLAKGLLELNLSSEKGIGKFTDYFEIILKNETTHFYALLGSAKIKTLNGENFDSTSILNALIVRYPKLSIPLIEKMLNHLTLKDWEQTMEIANRILTIDSTNLDAIKCKTVVTLCKDGDFNEGGKQIQLFLRNLMIAEPKNVDLLLSNIQLFSRIAGKDLPILGELIKATEKMLQHHLQNTDLMIELGNLYVLNEKIKDAENYYRNTVKVDESSLDALMGLANCQLLDKFSGSMELAHQQINFLIEIQANSMKAELLFMMARLHVNDSNKARQYLEMASKIILKDSENLLYGYNYLLKLNPTLCIDIIEEYLKHSSERNSEVLGSEKVQLSGLENKATVQILEKVSDSCPGMSTALLLLAKIRMQNGYLEDALVPLRKLLDSVDPSNAQAHLLMAQVLAHQGKYQQASQSLEVGLSYNFKVRDDPLYHLINGIVEKENGDLDSCIKSLKTAMNFAGLKHENSSVDKVTPISTSDKATLYLELISAFSKMRRFHEALELMEDAKIQLVSTSEESKLLIGNAELCLEMGDLEKAMNYLNKVKPSDPYYLQAHTKLAEVQLNLRKDRQAFAKCYRELVEHCPGPQTYSMLGDAYIAIQEPERAIEAYEEALKKNPNDKVLASKVGKALVKTHQYAKAIGYYKEAVKQEGCTDLKLDMAELLMKMKQFSKAESILVQELQDCRTATDLESLEARSRQLLLLAKVRERAGNLESALSTLKEAKENQVRCIQRSAISSNIGTHKELLANIYLNMASYCTSFRSFEQAIKFYNEALNHKPADVKALLSLAKLYMEMNDLDRCAESCSALLNADPNNEAASVMMADIAFRKVDFDTAAFHFRQLLTKRPTYWTALARLIEVSRRTGNMNDLEEWLNRAELSMNNTNNREAGYYYCSGLFDWRTGKLNSALRNFNSARRDPEWGQQAIYNMIEICLDPDDDSTLSNEAFNDEDVDYQDSRTMALKTAQRLLQELNPKGNPHETLTHRLLGNFFLLATKQKFNIEKALQDCTSLASQETLRDHVGPALGMAMAHILLKQTPRARNHLKRVSKNAWTFEDAEYLERCWLLLADIYLQSNKYDLANELLRKVLQHNATCVRAHELSGAVAEKDQNYREAALRYSQAWKFGGKLKLTIGYKLAYCSFKSKAYADAIEVCNEVLKLNPDYPRIRKEILEKSINNLRT